MSFRAFHPQESQQWQLSTNSLSQWVSRVWRASLKDLSFPDENSLVSTSIFLPGPAFSGSQLEFACLLLDFPEANGLLTRSFNTTQPWALPPTGSPHLSCGLTSWFMNGDSLAPWVMGYFGDNTVYLTIVILPKVLLIIMGQGEAFNTKSCWVATRLSGWNTLQV